MKIKFVKTVLVTTILTVFFYGCSADFWHPGDTVNTSPASKLASQLASLPENTVSSPHNIKLKVKSSDEFNFIRNALKGAPNKYIYLDLTGSSVKEIMSYEFDGSGLNNSGYKTLTGITIPNSVTSIGEQAFRGCINLSSVIIGNNVKTMGEYAFYECTSLTSVTIPNSVTRIERSTFRGCTSLTRVNIPNSITIIEGYAFSNCTSLSTVTIGSGVTRIGEYAFYECTSLTSVTIPDNITSIGNCAFFYCTSLPSVIIGSGVTSIGNSAFCGCTNLTSVNIPNSVRRIWDLAFASCPNLTSVTFQGTIPSSGFDSSTNILAFDGDLRAKFYATNPTNGTPGTYTTSNPGWDAIWTRQ
jgi:hypothetical protein